MIRNLLIKSLTNRTIFQSRYCTTANKSKEKWDLFAGVLVERHPIITKELNSIEKEYLGYLKQVEFEQSLKSDHELQKERDKKQAELIKKKAIEVDLDSEASKQTAQDFVDACNEELSKFTFAQRITDADKNNDTKSLDRKLDDRLILLMEQKIGGKSYALLPQGKHQDGETLRQTAERVIKENCGTEVKVFFYGNSPCGFYKYKYPSDKRKDAVGAKIFFFRTALKGGNITDKKTKFEWLNAEELRKKVKEPYYHSVSQFLIC